MSRTLEKAVSLTSSRLKLGIRDGTFSSSSSSSFPQTRGGGGQKQSLREEVVQLIFPPRSSKKKKTVSWEPGTVDNELMARKCYEKEFFFSEDIWG